MYSEVGLLSPQLVLRQVEHLKVVHHTNAYLNKHDKPRSCNHFRSARSIVSATDNEQIRLVFILCRVGGQAITKNASTARESTQYARLLTRVNSV